MYATWRGARAHDIIGAESPLGRVRGRRVSEVAVGDVGGLQIHPAITWASGAPIGIRPAQPVVALDFDGVLNVSLSGRDGQPSGGLVRTMIDLDRRHWPSHPYIRPLPMWGGPVRHQIVTNPKHLPMVQAWLTAGAAVIWATTWELAIREPARAVGLPDMPVLEMSAVPMAEQPLRTALWKLEAITTAFAGHPLAWVDDFAGDWEDQTHYGNPAMPFLAVAPDEYVGLTREQADAVTAFVRGTA